MDRVGEQHVETGTDDGGGGGGATGSERLAGQKTGEQADPDADPEGAA